MFAFPPPQSPVDLRTDRPTPPPPPSDGEADVIDLTRRDGPEATEQPAEGDADGDGDGDAIRPDGIF